MEAGRPGGGRSLRRKEEEGGGRPGLVAGSGLPLQRPVQGGHAGGRGSVQLPREVETSRGSAAFFRIPQAGSCRPGRPVSQPLQQPPHSRLTPGFLAQLEGDPRPDPVGLAQALSPEDRTLQDTPRRPAGLPQDSLGKRFTLCWASSQAAPSSCGHEGLWGRQDQSPSQPWGKGSARVASEDSQTVPSHTAARLWCRGAGSGAQAGRRLEVRPPMP